MAGPLHEMASTTPTDYWNDSCSVAELTYAIERGAVGATTNPTIVGEVLEKEMALWREWLEREARAAIDRGRARLGADRGHGGQGR